MNAWSVCVERSRTSAAARNSRALPIAAPDAPCETVAAPRRSWATDPTVFRPEPGVVLDTSALVAILFHEPEGDAFIAALADAEDLISSATLVEASIVMHAKAGSGGVSDLDALLAAAAVRQVAVDSVQARIARDAYMRFGKGHAPAGLNFGDCFSYALARATDRPLLFKGADFSRTDVARVII